MSRLRAPVSADLSGEIPAITASLAGQTLNIDALLGEAGWRRSGVGIRGRRRSGWSDAKIDFSALKSVNARLALSAPAPRLSADQGGPGHDPGHDRRRQAQLQMPTLKLYDGGGSCFARDRCQRQDSGRRPSGSRSPISTAIPSSRRRPRSRASTGPAAIALDLTTSGASQTRDGRRRLPARRSSSSPTARSAASISPSRCAASRPASSRAGRRAPSEKTDFAALGASFKIAKGQAADHRSASCRPAGAHDGRRRRRSPSPDAEVPRRSASRGEPRRAGRQGRPRRARRADHHRRSVEQALDLSRH